MIHKTGGDLGAQKQDLQLKNKGVGKLGDVDSISNGSIQ